MKVLVVESRHRRTRGPAARRRLYVQHRMRQRRRRKGDYAATVMHTHGPLGTVRIHYAKH